jgi:prepilin-type N-terminal cleavage/methylation domain-containing protein
MKKTLNRGFTLIELLVVIAIIGILASVVLASLNSARAKGSDAAIKSSINNARAQAELYYDSNGNSYDPAGSTNTGVCSQAGGVATILAGVDTANGAGAVVCNSAAGAYAIQSVLVSVTPTAYYCVDSAGAAKTGTAVLGAATVCP